MSKIDELRAKYPKIVQNTFDRLVDGDKTPTKKYLDYLLKSWSNRADNGCPNTINDLIKLVSQFDDLLPYLENKDIYHKEYSNLYSLKNLVEHAQVTKEEKTFVREEHGIVLDETDDYLLIQPLTLRGSLKWGANTKWCTSSRSNPSVFERYYKGGTLVYLIDKKNDKLNGYAKVAFYKTFGDSDSLFGDIDIFNANDANVSESSLISNGWTEDALLKVMFIFRTRLSRQKKAKKSEDYVNWFSETLTKLNFETLQNHLGLLEQVPTIDYISVIEKQLIEFNKNLKKHKDGFTKAKS
jgi:hypothetical protein